MVQGFEGMRGKSAIVTGGATLIGAGVVRALHQAGVRVVVVAQQGPKLEASVRVQHRGHTRFCAPAPGDRIGTPNPA